MSKITSQNLNYRPISLVDLPDYVRLCSDPESMKYISSGAQSFSQINDTLNFFQRHYRTYGYGVMSLYEKKSGKLVGFCGFNNHRIDGEHYVELGYRILKEEWGKGYATESCKRLVKHAFEDLNLPELISIIHPENKASIRVSQKIGMQHLKSTMYQGIMVYIYHIAK